MIIVEQNKCRIQDVSDIIKNVAGAAWDYLGLSGEALVELDFVSEIKIRELNARFRSLDKVTDVLSFPSLNLNGGKGGKIKPFIPKNYLYVSDENGVIGLGSIAICPVVCKKNAVKYGHSFLRETAYLFIHGLLHLLGYDHILQEDKQIMRQAEEEILSLIGQERV